MPSGSAPAPLPTLVREAGRRAFVCCPVDHQSWPTRIAYSSADNSLTIFAPQTASGTIRRHPGALLTIEVPTAQALYRLPCTLQEQVPHTTPLWILGDFRAIERIQRRRSARFAGTFPAHLIAQLPGQAPLPCDIPPQSQRNLSVTGCYLQSSAGLTIGTPVDVRLDLEPRQPLALKGEVVRTEPIGKHATGYGIHFTDPARMDQLAISRYIATAGRRAPHADLIA